MEDKNIRCRSIYQSVKQMLLLLDREQHKRDSIPWYAFPDKIKNQTRINVDTFFLIEYIRQYDENDCSRY